MPRIAGLILPANLQGSALSLQCPTERSVQPDNRLDPASAAPPITFHCHGCGLKLSIRPELAGTSGPCPSCSTWITSPEAIPTQNEPPTGEAAHPMKKKAMHPSSGRRRGRIPADSIIDHAHLDQRESARTLMVLAMFILAICACLAITWFMKDWLSK